jgi:hypothetical protein
MLPLRLPVQDAYATRESSEVRLPDCGPGSVAKGGREVLAHIDSLDSQPKSRKIAPHC